MNTVVKKSAATELSLPDRARRALAKVASDARLIELARQSTDLVAIIDKPGAQQVHSARMVLKDTRVEIEKAGKAARDDATKFSRAVIVEEQRLIALFRPEENRLAALEGAWEATLEAERQAKIEAEKQRIADIRNAIANIHDDFWVSGTESSARIFELMVALEEFGVGANFAEFEAEAQATKDHCLIRLRKALEAAKEREAEAVRIKAEREELNRQRTAQAAAAKTEAARLRAERESQEATLRAEREEAARVQREADDKANAEREEHDRVAAIARAAEEKKLADDRAELRRQLKEIADDRRRRDEDEARAIEEEQRRAANATSRPTDAEIIEVLSLNFRVHESKIIEWLLDMDLEAAGKALKSEFA